MTAVEQFPLPEPDADGGPYHLTTGPDGALWCTLVRSGRIARLSVDEGLTGGKGPRLTPGT